MSVLGPLLLFGTLDSLHRLDPPSPEEPPFAIVPSEHAFIEARQDETVIRARPWVPFRRSATITRGTRLVVRGEVESRDDKGCHGKRWYAVLPFGYVCSEHARPTRQPPDPATALAVEPGKRLPFAYANVRHDTTPSYSDEASILSGTPSRLLHEGMSLVVTQSLGVGGVTYVRTADGQLVAKDDVGWMGQGSDWQGVRIENAPVGPLFAWTLRDPTPIFASPDPNATKVERLGARTRVPLLEKQGAWWSIGDGRFARAEDLNEVHIVAKPSKVESQQWIDVDVGEQVLVAYRGARPEYATLVSSGRGSPTPLGDYPIWAKVASIDMNNQGYEDDAYLVQGVPWVLLFQGHNALHGAYWHDRFGNSKSHGCVNLAPRDARFVFEWIGPHMPEGWTGHLPADLHQSPFVHVRDSSGRRVFTQERPWGPPDTEEERKRLEEAEERRALAAPPPFEMPSSPAELQLPSLRAVPASTAQPMQP